MAASTPNTTAGQSAATSKNGPASRNFNTTQEILLEEAKAIHEPDEVKAAAKDKNIYHTLNNLNCAALCLSGGGIRSASFALGVIQALAAHPRPAKGSNTAKAGVDAASPEQGALLKNQIVKTAAQSLLGQFHYLSTVSGGGYIGSWLSAGVARTSLDDVWRKLVFREPKPEDEAAQISWLRTYSNYLTPKLGLTSADTWAAAALYVRNLLLNWLVFAPVLCALLIAIKLAAVYSFKLAPGQELVVGSLFVLAALLQISALRFALLHRPTRPIRKSKPTTATTGVQPEPTQYSSAQLHDERKKTKGDGGSQGWFLLRNLLPSVLAAFGFTLAFLPDFTDPILEWSFGLLAGSGAIIGAILYGISWISAWPRCDGLQDRLYWFKDFAAWAVAGGVYGAIIGWGIYLFTLDLTPLIGGITVTDATKDVLLLLIYGVPWIISAQLTAEMIFVGLTNWQPNSDADREWFGRSTGWFAAIALVWLAVTFLVLVGADLAFASYAKAGSYLGNTTGGIVSVLAGIITAVVGKSTATPALATGKKSWLGITLVVTTIIFLVGLVVGFSAIIDNLLLDHSLLQSPLLGGPVHTEVTVADDLTGRTGMEASGTHVLNDGKPIHSQVDRLWLWVGFVIAGLVAWIASKCVNINRFSLHALYRNRLIRAFLGATNPNRHANSFTGFDENDNLRVADLWKEDRNPKRLFHVINIALNIVSSKRLAWQERKAESFTVSPLHCGTACGGDQCNNSAEGAYRRTEVYAERNPVRRGISVGTAVAISGAAASPNMGYHSSPLVTILLALFNVRLGWWLGNPGHPGDTTYNTEGPKTAIRPLFDELFGRTTDENPYIYLSDGGHFENLGLYEMVRRRCRFIVVSDAGCDRDFQFEDLGNAVRKIWLDLGVSITFRGLNALRFRALDDGKYEKGEPPFHAIGTIDYPAADGPESKTGTILYIKPCFYRNRIENVGVRNYATLKPEFPHESTADQFFSESQFESYRALGFEMMDSILNDAFEQAHPPVGASLDVIFEKIANTVKA